MKKKVISGLFLMLWMALLIAAMVYPQGIFPVLAASGVWVACLLTWGAIPVALVALIKNGPLWQELRASLLKSITRKENVFISWMMRLLIVVSLAWTGWAITLVFYLLTVIATIFHWPPSVTDVMPLTEVLEWRYKAIQRSGDNDE
ncbi:DNZ54_00345 family protein [Escherichia coli]|uniref:DNZ54_00345 family protein n=1 Tax=Escherichia coli TaxID=562 RepID=UPI002378B418|nr:DNZ54_00345 family protein [Escherichia coli]